MLSMAPISRRILAHLVAFVALSFLLWPGLGCGLLNGDEPEPTPQPDLEAAVPVLDQDVLATQRVQEPMPTATTEPTVIPIPKPTVTPAPSPTPTMEPTAIVPKVPAGGMPSDDSDLLVAIDMTTGQSLLSSVPEDEASCIRDDVPADRLLLMNESGLGSDADTAAIIGCLTHDTMLRMFLTELEFLTATGPLSVETSQCIRSSLAQVDFASVMTDAYGGVDSEYVETVSLVGAMASLSCLNERESVAARVGLKIPIRDYDAYQCAAEKLGGPEAMAPLMRRDAPPPLQVHDAVSTCYFEPPR